MTEPLLRDGVGDFGRSLFEAADAEKPSPDAQEALIASLSLAAAAGVIGAAGTGLAGAVSTTTPATATVASGASHALVKWLLIGSAVVAPAAWIATKSWSSRDVADVPATHGAARASTAAGNDMAQPPPAHAGSEAPTAVVEATTDVAPKAKAAPSSLVAPNRNAVANAKSVAPSATSAVPSASTEAPAEAAPHVERARALADQVQLLDAARARMRDGDPRGALAALDDFDARHGAGAVLAPEASHIRAAARRAAASDAKTSTDR